MTDDEFGGTWNEEVVAYPSIYRQGLNKNHENLRQDGQDSNGTPPEHKSRVLLLDQPAR
jgi:hypothetical protein